MASTKVSTTACYLIAGLVFLSFLAFRSSDDQLQNFRTVANSHGGVPSPQAGKMRIMVTGGGGFVGSNLVDKLLSQGHSVVALDNFYTGRQGNLAHLQQHPRFALVEHNVIRPLPHMVVDQIYHLACPASPPHYQKDKLFTIQTSAQGTYNVLELARRVGARVLFSSTSEVYGDPEVHPQPETYWGNVNMLGPRSCYDEGKRLAETIMLGFEEQHNVEIRIARIFNTYGPRMNPADGRVVSNMVIQALQGKPLTIYGDGSQTRSFQYVDDLVAGLIGLMNSDENRPVNVGNPDEYTIAQFAKLVQKKVAEHGPSRHGEVEIKHLPGTKDDPKQRKPDISKAKRVMGWEPRVPLTEGIVQTIKYFADELERLGEVEPVGPAE